MSNVYVVLVGKPEGIKSLGDLDIDVRILLKLILTKQDMKMWTGFTWCRIHSSCWAIVNLLLIFCVPYTENFLTT
jgi:hypothetical protein